MTWVVQRCHSDGYETWRTQVGEFDTEAEAEEFAAAEERSDVSDVWYAVEQRMREMTDNLNPLELAKDLEWAALDHHSWDKNLGYAAAKELRRLYVENESLRAALAKAENK